jgi:hypothetical protein
VANWLTGKYLYCKSDFGRWAASITFTGFLGLPVVYGDCLVCVRVCFDRSYVKTAKIASKSELNLSMLFTK